MSKQIFLLMVLVLVLQVLGDSSPYWTEMTIGDAMQPPMSAGRGIIAGLSVGATNKATIGEFDATTHENLIPCGVLDKKMRTAPKETKGCRAKFLCDNKDTPQNKGSFEYCLVQVAGKKITYCGATNLQRFGDCGEDVLKVLEPKLKTTNHKIDYKTYINDNEEKALALTMDLTVIPEENRPQAVGPSLPATAVKQKKLDPTRQVDQEPLVPCEMIYSVQQRPSNWKGGGCWLTLSCLGPRRVLKCRLNDRDNYVSFCGVQKVLDEIAPCTPERLGRLDSKPDRYTRFKAPLKGRNYDAMISLELQENGVPKRRLFSPKLQDRVTSIIPCTKLLVKAPLGRKLKVTATTCAVHLSCDGDAPDYTCRMSNRLTMELSNCGPKRDQGVDPCTDEFLGLDRSAQVDC